MSAHCNRYFGSKLAVTIREPDCHGLCLYKSLGEAVRNFTLCRAQSILACQRYCVSVYIGISIHVVWYVVIRLHRKDKDEKDKDVWGNLEMVLLKY